MVVDDNSRRDRSVSRRRFVKAAGGSATVAGLAGCISSSGGSGGDSATESDGTGTQIGTSSSDEDVTVTWAAGPREQNNKEALMEAFRNAGLPERIDIEILAGSNVTDNRQSRYRQWLGSGRETPDLLQMDSGWTVPFIVRDQLENLSEALPDDMVSTVEEEYFDASVQTAKHPDTGDLFGIPLFPDFPTMQYRKDLLREAGYGDSDFETWAKESMSWKEFSKITKEAMEANSGVKHGYTFQANTYEGLSCCDFNEFMTSYGGAYFGNPEENLFGPVGDRPITVDEQPVLDAIKMVRTFIHGENDEHALDGITGDIAPQAVLQWTEEPSRKPFTNGDVVMHRNWPYSININAADDVFGEDLGVMPIPYGVSEEEAQYPMTGGPVAALGGWHNTMNPNAKNKSAAVEVMRVMMKPDFQLDMFELLGYTPPRPKLFNSDRARQVEPIGRYMDQLKVAGENAIPRPVTVVWPQESTKIAGQVNASLAGEKSPSQAMSDLKSTLEQIEQSV